MLFCIFNRSVAGDPALYAVPGLAGSFRGGYRPVSQNEKEE